MNTFGLHTSNAILVWCVSALPFFSWAVPLERDLPVSVFITANQDGSGLEIVADKYNFISVYDISTKSFFPLNIPFSVRSLNGQNVSYDLFMSHLGGQCAGKPYSLTVIPMTGGEPVVLNEKYQFAGIENDHGVVVYFPLIPQLELSQQCEGFIGFIAEPSA